jgi:hypothetical protein
MVMMRNWPIVIFSLVVGGMMIAPIMSRLQAHEQGGRKHEHRKGFIIRYHGIIPPDKEEMMINTQELGKVAKSHHLLVICTSSDDIPRSGKDPHIAKSAFYSITGDDVRIETPLTKEFLTFSAEQSRTMLTCFPAIAPNTVQSDEITTLESVYTSGGNFVERGVRIRADSLFKAAAQRPN